MNVNILLKIFDVVVPVVHFSCEALCLSIFKRVCEMKNNRKFEYKINRSKLLNKNGVRITLIKMGFER